MTARSAELSVGSYQLMRNGVRGDRTTANRESRIVEAMKKPRPTTAATTRTKSCAHATRAAWSMEHEAESINERQEAPPRLLLIGAILVAEFLDEKFFFGTNPRDDGHAHRHG